MRLAAWETEYSPRLRRTLGLRAAIAVNVANMIGTGIFLKTRVITCNVGNVSLVFCVWISAGLLALAGTFSYSEIAAMMPEAGGDYVFLRRAYGRLVGFMYGWMTFTVARAGSQAALAVSLAIFMNVALSGALDRSRYAGEFLNLEWHISGLQLVALGAIWCVTLINCATVAAGGRTTIALTITKMALVLAVGIGAFRYAPGNWQHFLGSGSNGTCEGVPHSARGGLAGFGAAILGALWAYDGWNNVAPLAGEIRDPEVNLPRAFVGATLVVVALYLFLNSAYFYTLRPAAIASTPLNSSVATEVLRQFMGPIAISATAIALMISSLGSLHASVLANSRIPFAMARDGLFFRALGKLSPRSNVPIRAICAQALWGSVLALSGSYDLLTDSVIFASWLFYGLSAGSLFVFRRTMAAAPRPYRVLGYPYVPALFIISTATLIVNTFIATPRQALLGLALILAGLPFYWFWSRTASGTHAGGH